MRLVTKSTPKCNVPLIATNHRINDFAPKIASDPASKIAVYVPTCLNRASTRLLLFWDCQRVWRTKSPSQCTDSSPTNCHSCCILMNSDLGQLWTPIKGQSCMPE